VPDLTGVPITQARTTVTNAGLLVGEVLEEASDAVDAGMVLRQAPSSGTITVAGAVVDMAVSSGPDDSGCGCVQCNSQKLSMSGASKALADFFLMGLSLVTLLVMSRKNK
jgi:hypothetical protein